MRATSSPCRTNATCRRPASARARAALRPTLASALAALLLAGCQAANTQVAVVADPNNPNVTSEDLAKTAKAELQRTTLAFYEDRWDAVASGTKNLGDVGARWNGLASPPGTPAEPFRKATQEFAGHVRELQTAAERRSADAATQALRRLFADVAEIRRLDATRPQAAPPK